MDVLNNRELATAFWGIVFFTWATTKKDIRASFKPLIGTFLNKYILIPFCLMMAYTLSLVVALDTFGLWQSHQIKNVIFWFATAGIYSFFQITKASEDPHYFSKTIKDNLKIIVVLQFIISVYTFSLWIELIVVPLMTLVVALQAFSQLKEEHKVVTNLMNRLLEVVGTFVIVFTIYKLITDFGEFGKVKTIYDLLVPTILSIFLLPFMYLLATFNNYQSSFSRLGLFIKDEALLKYAKLSAIRKFHLRFAKFCRWADSITRNELLTKDDIDASFEKIFQQFNDEKSPPLVHREQGWSPYISKDYLLEIRLKTGYYKNIYDDVWHVSSSYLDISDGIIPNNLAYYVEGDSKSAKSLTLKLNINEADKSDDSCEVFLDVVSVLFEKAMNTTLPEDIAEAILTKVEFKKRVDHVDIFVAKTDWIKSGQFDLKFKLQVV
jgi:hypothetical protein